MGNDVTKGSAKPPALGRGTRLRTARVDRGVSQTQLAELTGYTQSQVSAHERGAHDPRIATLVVYAKALGISVEALL